jgi:uncharacterized protein with HEPN domain
MTPSVRLTIDDILETIDRLGSRCVGADVDDFDTDWELRFVVERGVEIVSEATRRLPPKLKEGHPAIDWRSIAGIGNVLRHEYHRASSKILLDAVREDFPRLKDALIAMRVSLASD